MGPRKAEERHTHEHHAKVNGLDTVEKRPQMRKSLSSYAMFCVSEAGNNVYDTEKHPFVFYAQFYSSEKLVIMPISSLLSLAKDLEDPGDLTIIPNTSRCREAFDVKALCNHFPESRCGSTLLCQMLNRVPGTRVASEPWSLVHLNGMFNRGEIDQERHRELIKACVRIHCNDGSAAFIQLFPIK